MMKIEILEKDRFALNCSREELSVLNNALNNIHQAVDEIDYTTLIGATKGKADEMLALINAALVSE
jgi:hypothetical protein